MSKSFLIAFFLLLVLMPAAADAKFPLRNYNQVQLSGQLATTNSYSSTSNGYKKLSSNVDNLRSKYRSYKANQAPGLRQTFSTLITTAKNELNFYYSAASAANSKQLEKYATALRKGLNKDYRRAYQRNLNAYRQFITTSKQQARVKYPHRGSRLQKSVAAYNRNKFVKTRVYQRNQQLIKTYYKQRAFYFKQQQSMLNVVVYVTGVAQKSLTDSANANTALLANQVNQINLLLRSINANTAKLTFSTAMPSPVSPNYNGLSKKLALKQPKKLSKPKFALPPQVVAAKSQEICAVGKRHIAAVRARRQAKRAKANLNQQLIAAKKDLKNLNKASVEINKKLVALNNKLIKENNIKKYEQINQQINKYKQRLKLNGKKINSAQQEVKRLTNRLESFKQGLSLSALRKLVVKQRKLIAGSPAVIKRAVKKRCPRAIL